jgi:hypothetical protein
MRYEAPVGGILKLPKVLQRDLILLFVVKLAMLSVLYALFFSPVHRPSVDAEAHLLALQPER